MFTDVIPSAPVLRVVVAADPPLLAELLARLVAGDDVEVTIPPVPAGAERFDVALVIDSHRVPCGAGRVLVVDDVSTALHAVDSLLAERRTTWPRS